MKGKKIVSTLLALLLLASLPVSALAATWDIGKGDIIVNRERRADGHPGRRSRCGGQRSRH
ncbi:MAG: hypothetical protein ACLSDS_08810 [Oscillospiraceae bacterium]